MRGQASGTKEQHIACMRFDAYCAEYDLKVHNKSAAIELSCTDSAGACSRHGGARDAGRGFNSAAGHLAKQPVSRKGLELDTLCGFIFSNVFVDLVCGLPRNRVKATFLKTLGTM